MVSWETGDLGVNVQLPVRVTGEEPGYVFLRKMVERNAQEVRSKENNVEHNVAQVT